MDNKNKLIHTITIPPVSREFVKTLRAIFPKIKVKADTPIDNIKWDAAQQELIDWIDSKSTGTTVSGDGKNIKQEANTSALNKVLGEVK